ncbi:MAG TPA: hypothetical protein VFN94_01195 [Nitrospiria bacterium]|nr:hypothetical protein [Nitrospiria bacterium]
MLSGINTDIEHGGKTYHVQTEDGGEHNPVIVTHLFAGGAILSSQRVSYADVIKAGPNPDAVRELMKQQHQTMIKSLSSKDGAGAAAPLAAPPRAEVAPPPTATLPKGRRSLDDVIDEYLQSHRGHRS